MGQFTPWGPYMGPLHDYASIGQRYQVPMLCVGCKVQCRVLCLSPLPPPPPTCISPHSCRFDGHVVARLPFKPFPFLQGISRRNLMGTDPTDCSFIFLYILCTMSLREVCGCIEVVRTGECALECAPFSILSAPLQSLS